MTDAKVTSILLAHLGAFGSGELKKIFQEYNQSDKKFGPNWLQRLQAKVVTRGLAEFQFQAGLFCLLFFCL